MKPERLRISAFGPYPNEEALDFSELGENTLFLICGPTGAGKSTILDAMCYALYGKTSGAVRSGETMRSNYVGYDRETFVEFDFAIGEKHYRVYRSPTQFLERQKGDKSKPVEHKSRADFYEIDERGNEKSHITAKGVDAAVEKLLGVGVEQFRQIILLPQGDFRKLLLADSSDRQRIMQQLFQTQAYLTFEKKLQEETKALEKSYNDGKLQKETLLGTCHAESEEELGKQAVLNENLLQEKEKAFMEADRQQQVFLKQYDGVNSLSNAFLRMEMAEKVLKGLEEKKEEKQKLREQVQMVRASQLVTKEWTEAAGVKNQERTARKELQAAADGLPARKKAKEEADKMLAFLKQQEAEQKARLETKGRLEQYRQPASSYRIAGAEAEKLSREYERKAKEAERLSLKAEEAEKKAEQNKKNWLCMNRVFLDGQAFIMAEKLEEGKPCPVCGSLSHPHPAPMGTDSVTEEDVKRAERRMHDSEAESRKSRKEADGFKAKELAEAKEKADRAATVLAELEKALPAAYRDAQALEREIRKLDEDISSFEKKMTESESNQKSAELSYQNLKERKDLLEKQSAELARISEEKNRILQEKVREAGFGDWFECRKYREQLPQLETWEGELKKYDQQVHTETELVEGEKKEIAGRGKPDMEEWNKKRQSLLEGMKRLTAEKTEKEAEVRQQQSTLKKLAQLGTAQKEIEAKYSLVSHLWDVARGKDTGINLERFVLGALLDAVTEKANLRLMEMSGSRYELLRKRGERADARKTAGLDLEVFDSNTGRTRPASTLSGGETFLASLSLALGLADVVQEYAGGIHLDAMFIDEGFGSLDSESLDLAMKTLQELKGRNRLVGLISHVGGLEERIPARLRVKKTQSGSTASFEIGG